MPKESVPRVMSESVVRREIPDATVARLPGYLAALGQLADAGATSVSSEGLATAAGVRPTQVRKDLSHLGSYGVRGVGYDVETLSAQIARGLGLTRDWPVVIVGMGNLGRALASYGGFASGGFQVVAVADNDTAMIGQEVGGLRVQNLADLGDRGAGVAIGVIATPPGSAQQVADALVAGGVRLILNFAASVIAVPDGVEVRKVDLTTELQILAYHGYRHVADVPELSTGLADAAANGRGVAR